MTDDIQIRMASESDAATWDDYVLAHPQGTFFHRYGWKRLIESTYGYAGHYLFAQRAGRPCGVLPLGEVRHLLFGHSLISVPFCVYGGVLADDRAVREALEEAGLGLSASDLLPISRWVTPEMARKRFDTWFFAAPAADEEVIVDGGIRRGTHVLKAMAMGATACSGGRLYLYALAAAGQPGVERAISLLRDEIERGLLLMGCRSLADLDRSCLAFR